MIKAKKGHIIKAYLRYSFSEGCYYRALIDEYGLIFYCGCGGWSSRDQNEKIIPLPNQCKLPINSVGLWSHLWDHWWTATAWKDESWAWCHMKKREDD